MLAIQYDLFDNSEERDIRALERKVQELQNSNERVRKSLFMKINQFGKFYDELDLRLRIIEENICNKN